MRDTAADLARRGKLLPPEERQQLVAELLASLNEPAVSDLDAAWSTEIAERLAAYDRGEVQAIPADEVLARVRALAK
jgi:putative addiction module component (TIGR02574 family)